MTDGQTNPLAQSPSLNTSGAPYITPEQARELSDALVKSGAQTAEQAQARLQSAGIAPPADPRTDAEKSFDQMFGGGAPTDYNFDIGRGFGSATPAEVSEAHGQFAKWASDIRLPPSIARDLISEHMNARRREGMTAEEREHWGESEQRKFESVIGPDYATRAEAAARVLKQVSGRTINVAGLARTNGAVVATNVLLHAERLALRQGAK